MNLFCTAIVLGLIGVFCILDSRLLGRMNFEQPLITCTLVGIALGDVKSGLAIGASLELMSMGLVNIGAAAPPDMNLAAIIAAAYAIFTKAGAQTALTIAIPISILGQMFGILMRTILSNLTHVADRCIEKGEFKQAQHMHIVWGTVLYSAMYFIPIFLAVYFGTGVVKTLVAYIPQWLTNGLDLASKLLIAYGLALLLSMMLNKKLTAFFLLGFFIVSYSNINLTAIAIFACILAMILSGLRYKDGASSRQDSTGENQNDDPLEDDLLDNDPLSENVQETKGGIL